jgi:hypothetical protein
MNKSSNNINEEINRIKSLFTEERMYGNLIKEGTVDVKNIKDPSKVSGGCIEGDCVDGEGTWKDDHFWYEGQFKDGKKNGKGTYKNIDGDEYVGEFKDDLQHGQGTFTKDDGTIESGMWEDDTLVTPEKTTKSKNSDTDVEVFKDKGGKYSYSKLPDGTYWYSTDGSNWKKQTSQNGMDAIEDRINSDKVDSVGNVGISSIDSSYKGGESNQPKVEKGDAEGKISNVNTKVEKGSTVKPKEKVKAAVGKVKEKIKAAVGNTEKKDNDVTTSDEVVVDESDVTFKGCKKRLTGYIKLANDGTSMKDAFGDKVEEKTKDIQSCLGKYYNKFEKIGFMKKGKGVYLLKKLWDIDYERNIDGGIEGQKYEIIVNNRSRGKVKRVGKNEYRVISKPNETIFGRDKNFRDGFEEAVFNSLDLNSDENDLIVSRIIQQGPIQWAKLLRKDV